MRSTLVYSITALLLLFALEVDVFSLTLFNPLDDEGKYHTITLDSIPLEVGEKLLMYRERARATAFVILVNKDYEAVRDELRAIVAEKIGIMSQAESDSKSHSQSATGQTEWSEESYDGPWPLFGEGYVRFKALGLRFEGPKEYLIKSRPYN
jgi:hypothetical protein